MSRALMTAALKVCSKCKLPKLKEEFNRDCSKKDGLRPSCKTCTSLTNKQYRISEPGIASHLQANNKYRKSGKGQFSNWKHQLKKKYNLTPEKYDELLEKQNGVCAICKKPETMTYKGELKILNVDHNHETGKIRGLLCNNCNKALGFMSENITTLKNMIVYLRDN